MPSSRYSTLGIDDVNNMVMRHADDRLGLRVVFHESAAFQLHRFMFGMKFYGVDSKPSALGGGTWTVTGSNYADGTGGRLRFRVFNVLSNGLPDFASGPLTTEEDWTYTIWQRSVTWWKGSAPNGDTSQQMYFNCGGITLQPDTPYIFLLQNTDTSPSSNWCSLNQPTTKAGIGPHGTMSPLPSSLGTETDAFAGLDRREAVIGCLKGDSTTAADWVAGNVWNNTQKSGNPQNSIGGYYNIDPKVPWYGYTTSSGDVSKANRKYNQPHYAYSGRTNGTATVITAKRAVTATAVNGYSRPGTSMGSTTITQRRAGSVIDSATATLGSGRSIVSMSKNLSIQVGDTITIDSTTAPLEANHDSAVSPVYLIGSGGLYNYSPSGRGQLDLIPSPTFWQSFDAAADPDPGPGEPSTPLGALNFTGTDIITAPNYAVTDAMTVCCWVKRTASWASADSRFIDHTQFRLEPVTDAIFQWHREFDTTDGDWRITHGLDEELWTFLAVTHDASSPDNQPIFYTAQEGDTALATPSVTEQATGPAGTAVNTSGGSAVGNRVGADRPAKADMAWMNVYTRVLSAAEVLQVAQQGYISDANFAVGYQLVTDVGTEDDLSTNNRDGTVSGTPSVATGPSLLTLAPAPPDAPTSLTVTPTGTSVEFATVLPADTKRDALIVAYAPTAWLSGEDPNNKIGAIDISTDVGEDPSATSGHTVTATIDPFPLGNWYAKAFPSGEGGLSTGGSSVAFTVEPPPDTTPPTDSSDVVATSPETGTVEVRFTSSSSSDVAAYVIRWKEGTATFSGPTDGTQFAEETTVGQSASVVRSQTGFEDFDTVTVYVPQRDASGNWSTGVTYTLSTANVSPRFATGIAGSPANPTRS